MNEYRVKVSTDIGDSKQKLAELQRQINVLTGEREVKITVDPRTLNLDALKDAANLLTNIGKAQPFSVVAKETRNIGQAFQTLSKNSKTAKDIIVQTYQITRDMDGPIRKWDRGLQRVANTAKGIGNASSAIWNNKDIDSVMSNAFKGASISAGVLLEKVSQIGFALYGLNEIVGLTKAVFGGFFSETVGREVELREQILRTQASLASTSKVFANGREITDPFEKIQKLTKPIEKSINNIIERSIELSGVTSGEVVNMFTLVASSISNVGGTLKDAEDLAFSFAAGLGTLGLPAYQAPQEINSILNGYIDQNSRLAKALAISNEDIQKARGEEGGIVAFLKQRLEAVVAGQKIASKGFAGVYSNIKDLYELTAGNFGAGLLDPIIDGLTIIFVKLNGIRQSIFDIAKNAGRSISRTLVVGLGALTQKATGSPEDVGPVDRMRELSREYTRKQAAEAGDTVSRAFESFKTNLGDAVVNVFTQLGNAINKFEPTLAILSSSLLNFVQAFAQIKIASLNAIVTALAAVAEVVSRLTPGIAALINMWSQLLNTPVVKYLYEVTTTLKVLKAAGGDLLIQGFLLIRFITTALGPALAGIIGFVVRVITAIQSMGAAIAATVASSGAALTALGTALGALMPGKGIESSFKQAGDALGNVSFEIEKTNKGLDKLKGGLNGAGTAFKALGLNAAFFMGKLLLLQLAIAVVVDAIGKYYQEQDQLRQRQSAVNALKTLTDNTNGLAEATDAASVAQRSFNEALVSVEYDKAMQRVKELRQEIEDLRNEFGKPSWKTSLASFGTLLFGALFGGEGFSSTDEIVQQQIDQRKELLAEEQKFLDAENKRRNANQAQEDIRLAQQNRVNLEKEIGDLRRQQEDALFQRRQELARKEVEIFRAAGELRIFQMEQANAKLLEGQEGASRDAIQALNEYLTTRERGELDIESSRQELVIEIQNLEKSISDYRVQNELRIAEIRKKSAQYEQQVADYNRNQAAAVPQIGPVPFGAIAGRTGGDQRDPSRGNSSGAHLHAQSAMGQQQLIEFLNRALVFPNGVKLGPGGYPMGDDYAAHAARGSGGVDFLVPGNTPFSLAPGFSSRNLGVQGRLGLGMEIIGPNGGRATIGHLRAASTQGAAQSTRVDTPAPQAPDFRQLAQAPEINAEITRNIQGAMRSITELRAALTEARTLAAFENITKQLFPQVEIEQYKDQIIQANETMAEFARSSADAYDPDKARLFVEASSQLKIKQRELNELLADAKKKLSPEEYARLEAQVTEYAKKYKTAIAEQAEEKEKLLKLTREQAAIELASRTRDKRFETLAGGIDARGAMADSFYGDNPAARRRAAAEMEISRERLRLERERIPIEGETLRRLQEFAAATRASAEVLGQLDEAVVKFERSMELVRGAASTITDGYKGFFKEILTGGDLQEAMNSMLEGMTSKFLDMALDSAFQPFEKMLEEQFKKVFNINDPMQQLQIENNNALAANTAALNANTTAKGSPSTDGTPMPLPYDGSPTPVDILPDRGEPVTVEKLQAQLDQTTQTIATVNTELPALNKASSNAAQQVQGVAGKAAQAQSGFDGLMKNMGGAMAALGGIAMGVAGAQQMQKGGVYNTLMGLAGIFGSISAVAGGLSSFGGLGGGGGGVGGGATSATGLSPSSAAAIDKYSVPIPGNVTMKSFAGGGYTGAGAATGGMDGKGGFLAMLHPNETVTPGDPYAAATRSLESVASNRSARVGDSGPIKVETTVINNVEYATVSQLQDATRNAEKRGAERGRAMAMNTLQNSLRTRKKVGLS